MTIFSLNPQDREREDNKKVGPFQGQEIRANKGVRHRSPKFKGATVKAVQIAYENWLRPFLGDSKPKKDEDWRDIAWANYVESKNNAVQEAEEAVIFTTGNFLDKWWDESEAAWAGTTLATNSSTFNHWLKDEVLRSVAFPPSIDDIKDFYNRIDGSAATKNRVHKLLSTSFQTAVDERKITHNPCKFKAAPKKPKGGTAEAFTSQDEKKLLQYVIENDSQYWIALLFFAFDAGVRQQELFGLQYHHINFDTAEVSIEQTVDTINGKPLPKSLTKTDSSRRTISLSKNTLDALSSLLGQKKAHSGYVFMDEQDGCLWTRSRFHTEWSRLLKKAGLRHYKFHSTRHTMATRLLRAGFFLTAVSMRLGHSKPSITLDTYSHALPSDQGPLAAAFDTLVGNISTPKTTPEANLGLRLAS